MQVKYFTGSSYLKAFSWSVFCEQAQNVINKTLEERRFSEEEKTKKTLLFSCHNITTFKELLCKWIFVHANIYTVD